MWRRFRPPLALVAAALLGLIALLAGLQYRWLGQISDAERTQRRTTLAAGALEFAQDFDREITRAYLLFQADTPIEHSSKEQELADRFAARYDRWQATARFPRLVKQFYAFSPEQSRGTRRSIRRRRSPPVRSSDAPARAGRMAGIDEQLARSTRGRDVEGIVLVGQRALHPEDPVGDLGERTRDRRSHTGYRPGRAEARPGWRRRCRTRSW